MSDLKNENNQFPHILFGNSGSLHSTEEGRVWIRLLINLCWWLHDMYEIDSRDPDEKFRYIEQKIKDCHAVFPAQFTLMFSDPKFSPNDQHPLLLCRQEEHRIIILVFRATVSSKSIQDVLTDASIYSNHQIYLGSRHAGFAQRIETAPLLAVTNWLRRGWKIIITGHSLGGAVSQLFTAEVIRKLVEVGVSSDMVSLRCVTFGTPQCADHHFWSSYAEWYDVFDSYVYGNDAIFRIATFGADVIKKVIGSFVGYLQKFGIKLCTQMIGYNNEDLANAVVENSDQIRNITLDALVPTYSIFGRHHFIRRNEKNQLKIDSIGELEDEKDRLLRDLRVGHCWYNYFTEKKVISDQFTFTYREFMDHGCYPFSINQLFNQEIKLCLDKKPPIKQKLFRIETDNGYKVKNRAFDISAIINFPDGMSLCYIYFHGFLADFIISVKLPIELAESEQLREKIPTLSPDQPDTCAILCSQSNASIKYLQERSSFEAKVKTYFGYINVQVVVLSNFNSKRASVYQLDPILTVLRAYNEFILDTTSIDQVDSSLSRAFSLFFGAYKYIGQNEFDIIMVRYWAEAEARKLIHNVIKHIRAFRTPETKEAATTYFSKLLESLSETANNAENDTEEKRNACLLYTALKQEVSRTYSILPSSSNIEDEASARESELIPLYLDFRQLRKCLYELHNHTELSIVERNLKVIRAPYLFTIMKLNQLPAVRHYTFMDKMFQTVKIFSSNTRSRVTGLMGIGGMGVSTAASTVGAAAVGTTGAAAAATGAVGAVFSKSTISALLLLPGLEPWPLIVAKIMAALGPAQVAAIGGSATASGGGFLPLVFFSKVLIALGPAQVAAIFGPAGAEIIFGSAAAGATGATAVGAMGLTAMLGPVAAVTGVAGIAYSLWHTGRKRDQLFGDYEMVLKPFAQVARMVLESIASVDVIDENENTWQILDRIANCHELQELTHAKTKEERDVIWNQTFTKYPLENISQDDRWYFVSVIQICCQLITMRRILAQQPPKLLITGQSQTGKSTLFQYLTKRSVKQLRSNANFNTRMALQHPAFIEADERLSNDNITGDPGLPIDVIDNPGYDDATEQAHMLLDFSLEAADLVILVATLKDINQIGTINLLHKILSNTHVNILVLINQVDLRLKHAWEISRQNNSYHYNDSDEDAADSDESNKEFSLCKTLVELLKRPKEELIEKLKLKINSSVIEERITFQPVILKGFNEFTKTFQQPGFRNEVHKSNIDKWIRQNLLNRID